MPPCETWDRASADQLPHRVGPDHEGVNTLDWTSAGRASGAAARPRQPSFLRPPRPTAPRHRYVEGAGDADHALVEALEMPQHAEGDGVRPQRRGAVRLQHGGDAGAGDDLAVPVAVLVRHAG